MTPVSVASFLDAFRAAQQSETTPPKIDETISPERVLVFRYPESHLALFYRATDDLLFALKLVHENVSPEDAAAAANLPVSAVSSLVNNAANIGLLEHRTG